MATKKAAAISTPAEAVEAAVKAFAHTAHPNMALGVFLTGKEPADKKESKIASQVVTNIKRQAREGVPIRAEHAVKLAALAGCRPHVIRPDVFREQWTVARVIPEQL